MEANKCVGILTSGGDAPGMNAAIRAVTRAAIYNGFEVKGIMRGYRGLITDEIIPFQTQNVSNIIQQGGTIQMCIRDRPNGAGLAGRVGELKEALRGREVKISAICAGFGGFILSEDCLLYPSRCV